MVRFSVRVIFTVRLNVRVIVAILSYNCLCGLWENGIVLRAN